MFGILPVEVIDHILGWVSHRRDLLSFACASRACKALAIPKHTEYRVLCVSEGIDWQWKLNPNCVDVWTHLTRRSDLTSNIRILHFVQKEYLYEYPRLHLRIPTRLVEKNPEKHVTPSSESWTDSDATAQVEEIYLAVGMMDKLETFRWDQVADDTAISEKSLHLLTLVTQKPTLRCLQLADGDAVEALLDALKNLDHPVWYMTHFTGLSIGHSSGRVESYELSLMQNTYFSTWLRNLPSLGSLEVTGDVFAVHSAKLQLPALKRLSLFGQRSDTSSLYPCLSAFFINHPQMEEFYWYLWGATGITLPPGCLPNLRKLLCPTQFLWALEGATWLVGPLSRPRKLEELSLTGISETRIELLIQTRAFDHRHLKCLEIDIATADSLGTLLAVPYVFPNLTHFCLPRYLEKLGAVSYKEISPALWHRLLSKFPNLEVFGGTGLWSDEFKYIPQASDPQLVYVVQRFARSCPKLRKIRCPVELTLPNGVVEYPHQDVIIWREDPKSCKESKFMLNWLGILDDERERWNVKCVVVEPAPRDPFNKRWGDRL